jgi:hypothetical protein
MKNVLFLFLVLSINCFSQGKILSKVDADKLFGPVEISKEISSSQINLYTLQTIDKIMFKIINNEIYILDSKRNVLLPIGTTINSTEVFSVYSVSIVQKLLSDGGSPFSYVEKRNSVLTITNGDLTLEYSGYCPPFCPD